MSRINENKCQDYELKTEIITRYAQSKKEWSYLTKKFTF